MNERMLNRLLIVTGVNLILVCCLSIVDPLGTKMVLVNLILLVGAIMAGLFTALVGFYMKYDRNHQSVTFSLGLMYLFYGFIGLAVSGGFWIFTFGTPMAQMALPFAIVIQGAYIVPAVTISECFEPDMSDTVPVVECSSCEKDS